MVLSTLYYHSTQLRVGLDFTHSSQVIFPAPTGIISLLPLEHDLLVFVVLHQALHVPQLSVQFGLVVVDQVHLAPQTRHVGFKQRLHVGAAHALALQQLQLGLQHLILLLQETHLGKAGGQAR